MRSAATLTWLGFAALLFSGCFGNGGSATGNGNNPGSSTTGPPIVTTTPPPTSLPAENAPVPPAYDLGDFGNALNVALPNIPPERRNETALGPTTRGYSTVAWETGAALLPLDASDFGEASAPQYSILVAGAFLQNGAIINDDLAAGSWFVAHLLYANATHMGSADVGQLLSGNAHLQFAVNESRWASTFLFDSGYGKPLENPLRLKAFLFVAWKLPQRADALSLGVCWDCSTWNRGDLSFEEAIGFLRERNETGWIRPRGNVTSVDFAYYSTFQDYALRMPVGHYRADYESEHLFQNPEPSWLYFGIQAKGDMHTADDFNKSSGFGEVMWDLRAGGEGKWSYTIRTDRDVRQDEFTSYVDATRSDGALRIEFGLVTATASLQSAQFKYDFVISSHFEIPIFQDQANAKPRMYAIQTPLDVYAATGLRLLEYQWPAPT